MTEHRVLVLHNRYRVAGGEERAAELHVRALARMGIPYRLLERDSSRVGRTRAAAALIRGGEAPDEVADAVRELRATVVHVHNMQPLLGPRALAAARSAGARVVLHLHNFRLFCAIGVAFRDGAPCFRCRGRLTVPGVVLNCRGSWPEAAVYGPALALHQQAVFDAVDRFVAPSRYAVGQLVRLGVPADRIEALPHYLPPEDFAHRSRAASGRFALYAGRLSAEKGVATAVEAATLAAVPLKVAGDGPLAEGLRAASAGREAQVELLGRVSPAELAALRADAAMAVVPSAGTESFGFAALEAMGAGLPVVATRAGGLPELVGEGRCVPRGDAPALAELVAALWGDPRRRRSEGEALMARAAERFSIERFERRLRDLYDRLAIARPREVGALS